MMARTCTKCTRAFTYYSGVARKHSNPQKRNSGVCMNCWKVLRKQVYFSSNRKCALCKGYVSFAEFQCDHIVPLILGGSTELSNLQVTCRPCNGSKGGRSE